MNFKTTLILLVLVIAALLVVMRIQSKSGDNTTEKTPQTTDNAGGKTIFTVSNFATQAINSITIARSGSKSVIAREKLGWHLTEPVAFPMDQWQVDELNRTAAELRYLEKFKPGDKGVPTLKDINLDSPLATLTFASTESKDSNHTIKLGKTTIGGRAYVMVDSDESVYVVGDALHKKVLDTKPGDMRQRSLPSTSEGEATRVVLTRDGKAVQLDKTDGIWSLAAPIGGRGDSDAVRSLLAAVTSTRVSSFVADKPKDVTSYGLDKPAVTLVIDATITDPPSPAATTPGATQPAPPTPRKVTRTLRIGAPVDLSRAEYFATWSDDTLSGDVVFTIGKSTLESLGKNADAYRDARISTAKPADVRELMVARASEPYRAVKGLNGWAFDPYGANKALPTYRLDNGSMAGVIDAIAQAKAIAYKADYKPAGEPALTVSVAAIGRSEPEVLKIYAGDKPATKDKAGQWIITRNNETTGYVIESDTIAPLTDPLLTLRDRRALDLPAEKLARVVLMQNDGASFVFSRDVPTAPLPPTTQSAAVAQPSPWKLANADKFELSAWTGVSSQLAPLLVEKWTTEAPKPAGAEITAVLEFAGSPPRKLLIDAQTRLASLEGVDSPFVVSQSLVDGVAQEFRDRMALTMPANLIKSVEIKNGDKTVTAVKDEAGVYTNLDGEKINQQNSAGIFDLASGLRVSRYLAKPEKLGDDAITVTITASNKDSAIIRVSPVLPIAHLSKIAGGKASEAWVKLDDATLKKLRADLTAKEAPKPPPSGGINFPGMGVPPGGFGDEE